MVLEVAQFDITDGSQQEFLDAYAEARELPAATPGCGPIRMTQGVETPTRFVLLIEWDSVASHDDFRASDRLAAGAS